MLVLVAALLCLPCLRAGIPPGFDSEYHTAYQYHFSRQFWEGEAYPRWLASANKGNGSPIFLVQYPLPYFVTALLRPITPFSGARFREARELGVFCFLVIAGSALAARAWFRRRCAPWAATIGALVYVLLPYIFGQALYRRAGLGELFSFVWMPLALAVCDSVAAGLAGASALGLVFGLLLLSNGLSAVVFLPLMVSYAAVSWRSTEASWGRPVAWALGAVLLGLGVAGVYLLPLVAYRKLFDVTGMALTHPGFELGRWFVYATSASLTSNHAVSGGLTLPVMAIVVALAAAAALYARRAGGGMWWRVSAGVTLALGASLLVPNLGPALVRASGLRVSGFETPADFALTMLLTASSTVSLAVLACCRVSGHLGPRERLLLAVVCGGFVLMLPWSAAVWAAFPPLAILQFPFRLGGVVTVAASGLFAVALDDALRERGRLEGRPSLLVLGGAAAVVIGAGSLSWGVAGRFRVSATADLGVARNVDVMFRSYVSPQRLPALARRLHADVETFSVEPTPMDEQVRVDFTRGHGAAQVTRLRPRELRVSAECDGDAEVTIGQVYFPLWRAVPVAGSSDPPPIGPSEEGLIASALSSGRHDFELRFELGWPERWGVMLTLASALVAVGAAALGRRTASPAQSTAFRT
jgi:hypothetical protein